MYETANSAFLTNVRGRPKKILFSAPIVRIVRRGAVAGGAYAATSLVVLATLFLLNRHGDAALLRQILAIHFIASLAAGLEPGTAKAAALSGAATSARWTIAIASGLKALAAAPAVALVWWLSDPVVDPRLLILTPAICVAGFAATDLRVIFDLRGRHATAIWIKQGSLGGGLIVLTGLMMMGASLPAALAASTLARIGLIVGVLANSGDHGSVGGAPGPAALLRDPRWLSLAGASAIAAAGGCADRVFGLRFLSPEAWAGYFALYDVFSKFWFIPYVVTPVIFARTAAGRDAHAVTRWALALTAAGGALLTGAVGAALWFAPDLPKAILGSRMGVAIPDYAIVVFVGAVALNSLAQIRVAELQGRGEANRTFVMMALSAGATIGLFYVAARNLGAAGLLCAWLAKSIVELGVVYAPFWSSVRPLSRARGWAASGEAGM